MSEIRHGHALVFFLFVLLHMPRERRWHFCAQMSVVRAMSADHAARCVRAHNVSVEREKALTRLQSLSICQRFSFPLATNNFVCSLLLWLANEQLCVFFCVYDTLCVKDDCIQKT